MSTAEEVDDEMTGMAGRGQAGRDVPIVWAGRRVTAFIPDRLVDRELELGPSTVVRTATAAAEVASAAATLPGAIEPLARLLLRAEGVASSFIEGIRAPVVDIVLAEQDGGLADRSAVWVAGNLAATTEAVTTASDGPLSVEALCDWHRTLMAGSPVPERFVGVVRTDQGWIGGTNPTDAHLVTPPPEEVGSLLDDLVGYVNRTDVDPIAQAAIAHAQFELIHPFADGNGRVGRMLVAYVLTRRLGLVVPPPVSVAVASDVGGYTSGLVLFRMGDHEPWVRWFADAVARGGKAQQQLVDEVARLRSRWRDRLAARNGRALRRDAAAWQILDLLPGRLALTTGVVSSELGISNKAANAALRQLADAGVLLEYGTVVKGPGKPSTLYVSRELLALAGSNPLR
jgi:Fic family protein